MTVPQTSSLFYLIASSSSDFEAFTLSLDNSTILFLLHAVGGSLLDLLWLLVQAIFPWQLILNGRPLSLVFT